MSTQIKGIQAKCHVVVTSRTIRVINEPLNTKHTRQKVHYPKLNLPYCELNESKHEIVDLLGFTKRNDIHYRL